MAIAASTLMIIGTIASAATSVIGGIAANNQARFQSDVAKQNAQLAQQRAAAEAERTRRDTQRRLGATKTAFGASGVTLAGSPVEVLADQAAVGEEDAQLDLFGGAVQSRQELVNAKAARSQGQQALIGVLVKLLVLHSLVQAALLHGSPTMAKIPQFIERTRNRRIADPRITAPDFGSGRGIVRAGQSIGQGLFEIGAALADQEAQAELIEAQARMNTEMAGIEAEAANLSVAEAPKFINDQMKALEEQVSKGMKYSASQNAFRTNIQNARGRMFRSYTQKATALVKAKSRVKALSAADEMYRAGNQAGAVAAMKKGVEFGWITPDEAMTRARSYKSRDEMVLIEAASNKEEYQALLDSGQIIENHSRLRRIIAAYDRQDKIMAQDVVKVKAFRRAKVLADRFITAEHMGDFRSELKELRKDLELGGWKGVELDNAVHQLTTTYQSRALAELVRTQRVTEQDIAGLMHADENVKKLARNYLIDKKFEQGTESQFFVEQALIGRMQVGDVDSHSIEDQAAAERMAEERDRYAAILAKEDFSDDVINEKLAKFERLMMEPITIEGIATQEGDMISRKGRLGLIERLVPTIHKVNKGKFDIAEAERKYSKAAAVNPEGFPEHFNREVREDQHLVQLLYQKYGRSPQGNFFEGDGLAQRSAFIDEFVRRQDFAPDDFIREMRGILLSKNPHRHEAALLLAKYVGGKHFDATTDNPITFSRGVEDQLGESLAAEVRLLAEFVDPTQKEESLKALDALRRDRKEIDELVSDSQVKSIRDEIWQDNFSLAQAATETSPGGVVFVGPQQRIQYERLFKLHLAQGRGAEDAALQAVENIKNRGTINSVTNRLEIDSIEAATKSAGTTIDGEYFNALFALQAHRSGWATATDDELDAFIDKDQEFLAEEFSKHRQFVDEA